MKKLLIIILFTPLFSIGQISSDVIIDGIRLQDQFSGKDTVYNESVKARFYLFTSDTTLKIVYGLHNYSVHTYKREQYWHTEVEPAYTDSYSDSKGDSFFNTYPNAIILKCEDMDEPKMYNLFKNQPKARFL